MAFRLFAAKPLHQPMLVYCQLDSWEQVYVGILSFSFTKTDMRLSYVKMVAVLSRGRWVEISRYPVRHHHVIRIDSRLVTTSSLAVFQKWRLIYEYLNIIGPAEGLGTLVANYLQHIHGAVGFPHVYRTTQAKKAGCFSLQYSPNSHLMHTQCSSNAHLVQGHIFRNFLAIHT